MVFKKAKITVSDHTLARIDKLFDRARLQCLDSRAPFLQSWRDSCAPRDYTRGDLLHAALIRGLTALEEEFTVDEDVASEG